MYVHCSYCHRDALEVNGICSNCGHNPYGAVALSDIPWYKEIDPFFFAGGLLLGSLIATAILLIAT